MFSLKGSSLLTFDKRRTNEREVNNLKRIYHIKNFPCDTQMRTILDEVSSENLRPAFNRAGIKRAVLF